MRTLTQVVLVAVALGAGPGRVGGQEPKPLPAEVTAAWEKAGAKAGWLGRIKLGHPVFRATAAGKEGEVPAFQFREWRDGAIAKLPQPGAPFGLYLAYAPVTDTAIAELAA